MRRKSERSASKKAKTSPEKKIEKVKRTRSRRTKKQSTSSENESADDASPVREADPAPVPEVNPKTPVKEGNQEETQDQVWQVKAPEGAGDTGEIQKLKICLTRPPSTPERVDRSPRSKRKHSRATSSSDGTPSGEAPEEKRKGKHRVKRSHRESKDESEKTQESQDDEPESELKTYEESEKQPSSEAEGKVDSSENTISTTNEEAKGEKANIDSSEDSTTKGDNDNSEGKSDKEEKDDKVSDADASNIQKNDKASDADTSNIQKNNKASDVDTSNIQNNDKASDADTTVDSPKAEPTVVLATPEPNSPNKPETQDSQAEDIVPEPESPTRRRSASVDKSEILELHPEESKVELDIEADKNPLGKYPPHTQDKVKVSKFQGKTPIEESRSVSDRSTSKTGVVVSSESEKRSRIMSTDSTKSQSDEKENENSNKDSRKSFDRSDSIQSNQEEHLHNGQAAPLVISRKRRWGSRSSKITKQKSITISTDVLKDIIPDVKPVEFEEVVEEKKHKRVVTERIERPVLPKIVIDNSENVQRAEQERNADRKDHDEKDIMKPRDMASNRKISIIKENDSIITRPPSPPRHKQSRVLYITNLVRPFTLPQLKNLLQRTGRLVENGFWIDRIKSKCYVIYETEDQAVETRHALHGVTWPVSNPKSLQVDFSTQEAFDKAKLNEDSDNAQVSTIPGTVEDWLREQDMKRERGEVEKPWERKLVTREWDLGKNEKDKEKERLRREERPALEKRRHRTPERSPEPARKFKKKEEEAPAKLLDDLFKKTKTTPCIYWLPLSAETIAIKEEQRRQHMLEHERRMQEQRRTHRRH